MTNKILQKYIDIVEKHCKITTDRSKSSRDLDRKSGSPSRQMESGCSFWLSEENYAMKNIYFTADTHFNHANIISFCQRPFASVAEMNEALIAKWNARVGEGDLVYHLGDFAGGTGDPSSNG
jgi:hypothetical protein